MGIESDQVVYDYLSRVGDLAQATTLTAAERARLVTGLREAIDTRRAESGGGAGSSVSQRAEASALQKILKGIGTPDEVVRRAVSGGVPVTPSRREARTGAGRGVAGVGKRAAEYPAGPSVPVQPPAQPGGAAPADRASAGGTEDWWRHGGGARGVVPELGEGGVPPLRGATVGELPGWRATYEPDFLDPDYVDPRTARVPVPRGRSDSDEQDEEDEETDPTPTPGRRVLARLLRRTAPPVDASVEEDAAADGTAPLRGPLPLVESLAALVLVSAAVLGLWYVALLGWFLAYTARRIGHAAAHTAGLWLPLLVAALCGFGLYSHVHGQPTGHQLTDAQFKAALRSATSLWFRAAPACSAAFLAWRISRVRRGY